MLLAQRQQLKRRRYIPELKSNNYMVRQFGQRVAMNTPIQGTAADIMKIAMINVMKELKSRYENIGSTEIRNNYINRAIDNAGEEGETNLKTNMEESITKSQENRKKYLDSLSGAVQ